MIYDFSNAIIIFQYPANSSPYIFDSQKKSVSSTRNALFPFKSIFNPFFTRKCR